MEQLSRFHVVLIVAAILAWTLSKRPSKPGIHLALWWVCVLIAAAIFVTAASNAVWPTQP